MTPNLDQQIENAAVLAALVLVLLPLFTSTRETALIALRQDSNAQKSDAERHIVIAGCLLLVTALVFLAGLPLLFEVMGDLSPASGDGVSRSLFAIVWLLLLGLFAWQVSLIKQALHLRSTLG